MIDIEGNYTPDEIFYKDRGGPHGEYAKLCKLAGKLYLEEEQKGYLENNGVDGIYKGCGFHHFTVPSFREDKGQRKAKSTAMRYAAEAKVMLRGNGGKRNLFLSGSVGTGKTLLASATLNQLAKNGIPCLFTSANRIFCELKSTFKSNDRTEKDVLEKYKTAKILVIDDLGKEKASKWTNDVLFRLIDYRYAHGLGTVITTNHTPAALEDRLIPADDIYDRTSAKAILSRLLGSAYRVELLWEDYRFRDEEKTAG